MSNVKVKRQVSSGGVIYRNLKGRIEVAITAHKDLQGRMVWSLPKGLVESDERPEEAAVREVREETGLEGRIINKLGETSYWFYSKRDQARIHKTVHFYLLECTGGDTKDHDWEVEEVRWVPFDKATELLAYKGERDMVIEAERILNTG